MADIEKINKNESDSSNMGEFWNSDEEARESFEWENSYEAHEARWWEEQRIQDEEDEQLYRDNLPPWERTLFPFAVEYAKLGWKVIPAKFGEGSKKSYVAGLKNGLARWGATTCLNTLYSYSHDYPDALIGVATGSEAEGGSGIFVLDIDTMEGHKVDGLGNLEKVLAGVGKTLADLPQTVMARTPTGGWHLYYKYPPDLGSRKFRKDLAPGVDIQSDKRMIFAPPSFRAEKGAPYVWERSPFEHPMAQASDWFIELILKPKEGPKAKSSSGRGNKGKGNTAARRKSARAANAGDGKAVLDATLFELRQAQTGERNDTLNKCAFKLGRYVASGQLEEGAVVDELTAVATEIGLDAPEIERTIASGLTAGIEKAEPTDTGNHTAKLLDIDLSDHALAKEFGHSHFGEDARYCSDQGTWYLWDGNLWRRGNRLGIQAWVRSFLEAKANSLHQMALADATGPEDSAVRSKWAKKSATELKSMRTISAVEKLARSNESATIESTTLDADPLLLGTPDGTVDLRTGELRPSRREDLITKSTSVTPAERGDVPHLWLACLDQWQGSDQGVIDYLEAVAGYGLTGRATEHKLFFLHGTGRNGKSVFLNTLQSVFGDYACNAEPDLFCCVPRPPAPDGSYGPPGEAAGNRVGALEGGGLERRSGQATDWW